MAYPHTMFDASRCRTPHLSPQHHQLETLEIEKKKKDQKNIGGALRCEGPK
jgi:hypothetical protein